MFCYALPALRTTNCQRMCGLFTNITMETNKTVQFIYNFQNFDGQPLKLEHPIILPYRGDVRELSHEIVSKQMDPIMKMLDAHEGDTDARGGKI